MMDITWKTLATGIVSPEGPAVDRAGNVFLVSRWTGRVVRVDPSGQVSDLVQTGGKPQSVALLESGDLLLADARNHALQRISPTGKVTTVAASVRGAPFLGPNDLVVADKGVVYMTDPGLDMEAPGQIVRIEIDSGQTVVVAEGFRFPNGVTITADGRFLFVSESVTHRILRFEVKEQGRSLGPPECFYQFADHHPDGIAFDADGNLLVAMCGGGTLEVISPRGVLVASIATGGRNTTNCVFGGDDFQTLYVTEDDQQALLMTRWPEPGQRRFSRSLSGTSR